MQAQGDPARVQLAYERAVAVFPVTHYLWSQYAKYMEQNLGRIPKLVQAVYQRALRNCPWVGSLWAGALRAAERLGSSQSDQESLYNQALQAGMQTQEDYMEVSMPLYGIHALHRGRDTTHLPVHSFTDSSSRLQASRAPHLPSCFFSHCFAAYKQGLTWSTFSELQFKLCMGCFRAALHFDALV